MKKYKIKIAPVIIVGLLLFSCNEDFLDLKPKDRLTPLSTFASNENIESYTWQFYQYFPAYEEDKNLDNGQSFIDTERHTDLGVWSQRNAESPWIWQKVEVPSSSSDYNTPYSRIRACNILLENLDEANISDTDKKHWRSVAYFFKAYNYIELINKYGDITWVENNLTDEDEDVLFGPRTPRDEVAANILELLQYAEANIKPNGNGQNTINTHVVRALMSRFGLREGTWRKYHGLPNADIYLNACVSASEPLLVAFPTIMAKYTDVFTSLSLAGKPGIILYKQYDEEKLRHRLSVQLGTSQALWDLTRKAIDMYLMKDGQTRWTSPLFEGEYGRNEEFRNRDTRLFLTVVPPYEVIGPGTRTTFVHTGDPYDQEFFPLMDSLSTDGNKALPYRAWVSFMVQRVPHFRDNPRGQSWCTTFTGYMLYKWHTSLTYNLFYDWTDAPIFRIEEVMLNYAEAKKELDQFNQTICDQTINKLRARGGVAPLNLSNIPHDPTRDPDVDQVMWEIRRERAIELMGEGYRFDDLRRWKKMDYATERKLGKWIVAADEDNRVPILNNATEGYVSYWGVPPTPFPEHYYLYPIPTNQIELTGGAVIQNPGW
jgi:starch-binding outer membrane protein, SusD/RagB family